MTFLRLHLRDFNNRVRNVYVWCKCTCGQWYFHVQLLLRCFKCKYFVTLTHITLKSPVNITASLMKKSMEVCCPTKQHTCSCTADSRKYYHWKHNDLSKSESLTSLGQHVVRCNRLGPHIVGVFIVTTVHVHLFVFSRLYIFASLSSSQSPSF